jgi:hypothetical protein
MKLPTPDELTDDDRDAVERIVRQADGLADRLLAATAPSIAEHFALRGLARLAAGSGLFDLPQRCAAALNRPPPAVDLAAWQAREDRMAALRGAE